MSDATGAWLRLPKSNRHGNRRAVLRRADPELASAGELRHQGVRLRACGSDPVNPRRGRASSSPGCPSARVRHDQRTRCPIPLPTAARPQKRGSHQDRPGPIPAHRCERPSRQRRCPGARSRHCGSPLAYRCRTLQGLSDGQGALDGPTGTVKGGHETVSDGLYLLGPGRVRFGHSRSCRELSPKSLLETVGRPCGQSVALRGPCGVTSARRLPTARPRRGKRGAREDNRERLMAAWSALHPEGRLFGEVTPGPSRILRVYAFS
jgi:hypothetical protein